MAPRLGASLSWQWGAVHETAEWVISQLCCFQRKVGHSFIYLHPWRRGGRYCECGEVGEATNEGPYGYLGTSSLDLIERIEQPASSLSQRKWTRDHGQSNGCFKTPYELEAEQFIPFV